MSLSDALKKELVQRGYALPLSNNLTVVDAVAQLVTQEGDPNAQAKAIVDGLKVVMPPELVLNDGLIGWHFSAFDYDTQLSYLLASANNLNIA